MSSLPMSSSLSWKLFIRFTRTYVTGFCCCIDDLYLIPPRSVLKLCSGVIVPDIAWNCIYRTTSSLPSSLVSAPYIFWPIFSCGHHKPVDPPWISAVSMKFQMPKSLEIFHTMFENLVSFFTTTDARRIFLVDGDGDDRTAVDFSWTMFSFHVPLL